MQGQVKILYGGQDVFLGICPTPFMYFDKNYIEHGSLWGSKYDIKFEGQITGKLGPTSFYDLETKKDKLVSSFASDNLPIKITEDGVDIFTSDICQIDSVSFGESRYYALLPFTISVSCYDRASFKTNYGIVNPVDSWSYTENEDGTLSLAHSVSAAGFNSAGESAIKNAKTWVATKTGISKRISSSRFTGAGTSDFLLESISEEVDRLNGTYSLQEIYKADLLKENSTGEGILRYTVDVSKNADIGITDVSIQGSVAGKKNIGLVNMSLLRAKLNATDFFQVAANAASKSTGASKLNDKPYTRSVSENQNNSEISFQINYDDDPVAPGQAKCIYKVELSEDLIKKIVNASIEAEIVCDRGDASVRWGAVTDYYGSKFNAYNLVLTEYKRAGYSKTLPTTPRSESINFDEFNNKISYSASWSDKYMPYPDILASISEKVTINPSITVHTIQPSLYVDGSHNVQNFGCASRASVSISIDATCRPDKGISEMKTSVLAELNRLKSIYAKGGSLFTDENVETINENMRRMSVSYSCSFEGSIIS